MLERTLENILNALVILSMALITIVRSQNSRLAELQPTRLYALNMETESTLIQLVEQLKLNKEQMLKKGLN